MRTKNKENKKDSKARRFLLAHKEITIPALVMLALILLKYILLPLVEFAVDCSVRSPHDVMLACNSHYNRYYMQMKNKDAVDKMDELSADSIRDIEIIQDARTLSLIAFVGSRENDYITPDVLEELEIEYVEKINDTLFAVVYASELSDGERIYFCMLFEPIKTAYKAFKYTGVSLWIPPSLAETDDVLSVYSGKNNKDTYIGNRFESAFGYDYIPHEKPIDKMYLSAFYKGIMRENDEYQYGSEYYLTSDGVIGFTLDKHLAVLGLHAHTDSQNPLFEGEEFASFLDRLRDEATKGATS